MPDTGLVRIDAVDHRAWVGDRELRLSFLQWRLLILFAVYAGRTLSRDELCTRVWPSGAPGSLLSLKQLISDLRCRLGDTAMTFRYIRTVRGDGYRFDADLLDPASVLPRPPAEAQTPAVAL